MSRSLAVTPLLLVTACSSPVEVSEPDLDATDAAACADFIADVPAPLVDLPEVDVAGSPETARAFGDPTLVVTCLDGPPTDFSEFAVCLEVNGIGWYTPDDQLDDETVDATFTAVGYRPVVQVRAPADYRPEIAAAVLSDLSAAVEEHLTAGTPCR